MIRVRLLVSGRVQGVWYRASARDRAVELGLRGWVRNLPDGTVEAVAEGPQDGVQAFIDWCREGPRLAVVREVVVEHEQPTGEFDGFGMRY